MQLLGYGGHTSKMLENRREKGISRSGCRPDRIGEDKETTGRKWDSGRIS